MNLRNRLTLLAAVAVAVTVVAGSVALYMLTRAQLLNQIDDSLVRTASAVTLREATIGPGGGFAVALPEPEFGGPEGYGQVIGVNGPLSPNALIPTDDRARAVAAGGAESFFENLHVDGVHLRVLTTSAGPGMAVQVARPLTETDRVLRNLAWTLLAIAGGGVALAALLGRGIARVALAPVERLTTTTERVTTTGNLTERIQVTGRDELSRLAESFNAMLEALEGSLAAQKQLVADASHELRTPITSIRTNIELLGRTDLPEGERRAILHDVADQLEELTSLVQDVVELARGSEPEREDEEVSLDEVVIDAVERARRHHPLVSFELTTDPGIVRGDRSRLLRAVGNLLDNAAKWTADGSAVTVTVRNGEVVVRDRGPGIDEADLPYVFDRFYRSPAARGLPGSGLGLAIVRQVAESHGGEAIAGHADGGGAEFRLRLPTV